MKKYIDTHAHVFKDTYGEDLNDIISKSLEVNDVVINIGYDLKTINEVLEINKKYKNFIPVIGLHPTEFNFNDDEKINYLLEQFSEICKKNINRFVSIGEIGFDYFHSKDFKNQQKIGFEFQVNLAKKINKPIIIHVRDAIDDLYSYIEINSDIKFLIHSWSGNLEQTKKFNKLKNVFFGINGIITFKNSNLKENLKYMDLDKILVETDSPWLSPVPFRGKKNNPSNVKYVYEFLIKHLNIEEEYFINRVEKNYNNFFGKEVNETRK